MFCLNNLRQLQLCWQMYCDDHAGRVPPNLASYVNRAWRSSADSWIGSSSAPHDTNTWSIENGLLFKYDYNRSVRLYRCPADLSRVRALNGNTLPWLRTRSYSMNGNLGGRTSEVQRVVSQVSDLSEPSRLFVFVDEQEDSIDDAHFLVWPDPDDRWVNLPAGRHAQHGVLSFADGRVEAWKWKWRKQFITTKPEYWMRAENAPDLADLRRLQSVIIQPRP